MSLFDAYVMVDWSANSTPKRGKDSIWIGIGEREAGAVEVVQVTNAPTRMAATQSIRAELIRLIRRGARVLVGFDFPYGYPHGFAQTLGCPPHDPPWRFVWNTLAAKISDDSKNNNNRFVVASSLNRAISSACGPFWQCPTGHADDHLRPTSCEFPYRLADGGQLRRWRHTDAGLRASRRYVQEVWKLGGAGSVGSQALVGIPHVAGLRDDSELASVSQVWPFETNFGDGIAAAIGARIVHAEIWPGILSAAALETLRTRTPGSVRDALQVEALVRFFASSDDATALSPLFEAPRGLSAGQIDECRRAEGWILGGPAAVA